jgi:hypothetical protein
MMNEGKDRRGVRWALASARVYEREKALTSRLTLPSMEGMKEKEKSHA